MGSKQWGGRRPGAGRPQEYVKIPVADLAYIRERHVDVNAWIVRAIEGEIHREEEAMQRSLAARAQLVAYARQIAQHRGYIDLVNGLQSRDQLEEKDTHEWQEFREKLPAYLKSPEDLAVKLPLLHEAADIYYSACCLEAQMCQPLVDHVLADMALYHLERHEVEAAALAKYAYRASAPGMKNEEEELSLIEAAITEGEML